MWLWSFKALSTTTCVLVFAHVFDKLLATFGIKLSVIGSVNAFLSWLAQFDVNTISWQALDTPSEKLSLLFVACLTAAIFHMFLRGYIEYRKQEELKSVCQRYIDPGYYDITPSPATSITTVGGQGGAGGKVSWCDTY